MDKKKKYEIIFLVFIVILAIISLIFAFLKDEVDLVDVTPDELEMIDDLKLSDEKILEEAILSGDSAFCNQVEDILMKDRCLRLTSPPPVLSEEEQADQTILEEIILISESSNSSCNDIVDPLTKDRCLRLSQPVEVIESEFVGEPTSELLVSPDEDLFNQALLTSDSSLCNEIQDATIKDRCVRLTS
jgi:hypothetical protein